MNRAVSLLPILVLLVAACGPGAGEPANDAKHQVATDTVTRQGAETTSGESPGTASSRSGRNKVDAAAGSKNTKPNVVRWSTASEHDSFGYDIYRGSSEDGPFSIVNREVIPGAGTTDMPNSYEFVDDTVEPGATYWYYIESISLTGERKRITPVYPSKRKSANEE